MNIHSFRQFLVFVAKAAKIAHSDVGHCKTKHRSLEKYLQCINQGDFDVAFDVTEWETTPIPKEKNMKKHINVRPIVAIQGNTITVQPRSVRVDYLPEENELSSIKGVLQSFLTKDTMGGYTLMPTEPIIGYTAIWGDKILVITDEKAFLSGNAKIVPKKMKFRMAYVKFIEDGDPHIFRVGTSFERWATDLEGMKTLGFKILKGHMEKYPKDKGLLVHNEGSFYLLRPNGKATRLKFTPKIIKP